MQNISFSETQLKNIVRDALAQRQRDADKPFVVSVMGQTGVGKSSLINALFGTNLATDPVRPCTKAIERVIAKSESGSELWFYDLPGIGESDKADEQYLSDYKEKIFESDVVLWAIHSDTRSVTFDKEALQKILNSVESKVEQTYLLSKITFILTKVDLLTPPAWGMVIGKKIGKDLCLFAPPKSTRELLEKKASYYREEILKPYGELIISRTYNDSKFGINEPPLFHDDYFVYCRGFLEKSIVDDFKKRFGKHQGIFDRLYNNYQVIPCSSLFKFNLWELLSVVVNKIGEDAVSRFDKFTNNESLNKVPISEAVNYCNLIVYDRDKDKVVFDLADVF